jgi:hypothetical protein
MVVALQGVKQAVVAAFTALVICFSVALSESCELPPPQAASVLPIKPSNTVFCILCFILLSFYFCQIYSSSEGAIELRCRQVVLNIYYH